MPFWLHNGGIAGAGGVPILCDDCPCPSESASGPSGSSGSESSESSGSGSGSAGSGSESSESSGSGSGSAGSGSQSTSIVIENGCCLNPLPRTLHASVSLVSHNGADCSNAAGIPCAPPGGLGNGSTTLNYRQGTASETGCITFPETEWWEGTLCGFTLYLFCVALSFPNPGGWYLCVKDPGGVGTLWDLQGEVCDPLDLVFYHTLVHIMESWCDATIEITE